MLKNKCSTKYSKESQHHMTSLAITLYSLFGPPILPIPFHSIFFFFTFFNFPNPSNYFIFFQSFFSTFQIPIQYLKSQPCIPPRNSQSQTILHHFSKSFSNHPKQGVRLTMYPKGGLDSRSSWFFLRHSKIVND